MTKVQLSFTEQEAMILGNYGAQFGYNLPKTVRFVISKAVEKFLKDQTPVYYMSEQTERRGLDALKEYRSGKTTEVKDVGEFFNKL